MVKIISGGRAQMLYAAKLATRPYQKPSVDFIDAEWKLNGVAHHLLLSGVVKCSIEDAEDKTSAAALTCNLRRGWGA